MRATWLLVALAGAAPGLLAAEVPPALADTLAAVETAFREEDARALRETTSSRTRVRVDLGRLSGGSASYAAGQLQVVLDGVFARRRTNSFDVVPDGVKVDAETAYAQARWSHRAEDGEADPRRDTVTLVLRLEENAWQVVEMRTGR